jgi:hypothetical protein
MRIDVEQIDPVVVLRGVLVERSACGHGERARVAGVGEQTQAQVPAAGLGRLQGLRFVERIESRLRLRGTGEHRQQAARERHAPAPGEPSAHQCSRLREPVVSAVSRMSIS